MKYIKIIIVTIICIMLSWNINVYALDQTFIEVSDKNKVWQNNSSIDIFGSINEKIIAPGSHDSYTFKIRNLVSAPVDYVLDISCFILPKDVKIPIKYKLKRSDGVWVMGCEDEYIYMSNESSYLDRMSLSAYSEVYYTLEWMWSYESNNDTYDTYLGDQANSHPISFTMNLDIKATKPSESDQIVNTGDNYDIYKYGIFLSLSLIGMYVLNYKNR